jgi:hypothetical protein
MRTAGSSLRRSSASHGKCSQRRTEVRSSLPLEEFRRQGRVEIKIGDFVSVAIKALGDGATAVRLSRDKAKRLAACSIWKSAQAARW